MIIKNIALCLRPYGINKKQVHRIYFYNNNGVIFQSRSGWLEKSTLKNLSDGGYLPSQDIKEIELKKDLIRKIKKDLTKTKESFYIKAEKIHDWESSYDLKDQYDLYIYVDNKDNIKVEKIQEHTQDEEGSTYINTVKYTEYKTTGLTPESFTMVKSEILKSEDTKEKIQAEKILQVIKDKKLYINISDYDLCKLLKHFEIKEK